MAAKHRQTWFWGLGALGAMGVVLGMHQLNRQHELRAQQLRTEQLQNQVEYPASAFACTVRMPSGAAHRANAYEPFTYRGHQAELATCNDAVDGESWAEFYAFRANGPPLSRTFMPMSLTPWCDSAWPISLTTPSPPRSSSSRASSWERVCLRARASARWLNAAR